MISSSSSLDHPGMFIKMVAPGGVAYNAGLSDNDRLVEFNGENIEGLSHERLVEKIKKAGNSLMLLVVDKETDEYYKKKSKKIGVWVASLKHLPHKPRIADISKGPKGFGFTLTYDNKKAGRAIITCQLEFPVIVKSQSLRRADGRHVVYRTLHQTSRKPSRMFRI